MLVRFLKDFLVAAVVAVFLFSSGPSNALESSGSVVSNGVLIYYAIVPAEIIRSHPKGHPESEMHGGVPSGKRERHLMVALFDNENLDRITNADVTATVAEVGLAGQTKRLESFTVSGALTYGNYFEMDENTNYRIRVTVRLPEKKQPVTIEFEYIYP